MTRLTRAELMSWVRAGGRTRKLPPEAAVCLDSGKRNEQNVMLDRRLRPKDRSTVLPSVISFPSAKLAAVPLSVSYVLLIVEQRTSWRSKRSSVANVLDAMPCSPRKTMLMTPADTMSLCKTGKHTTEKPAMKAVPSVQRQIPRSVSASKQADASKQQCSRCQQGFFCSDHGSQPRPLKPCTISVDSNADGAKCSAGAKSSAVPAKKIIDLNAPQTCRNKACGKVFKEKENHEIACEYHPGPAVFHDGRRGWKCCDVHVKEFDEFMTIPPCTKGWHNADPVN